MWKLLLAVGLLFQVTAAEAKPVSVKGYVRKDGTYVAPHVRSSPNSSKLDNYSTKGNVNPYNGRTGTVDPYRLPSLPSLPTLPSYPIAPPAYLPDTSYYTPPTYRVAPAPRVAPVRAKPALAPTPAKPTFGNKRVRCVTCR